jgi:hypothetical protein
VASSLYFQYSARMSKRRHDDEPNGRTQAPSQRSRNPPGFRVAQSRSQKPTPTTNTSSTSTTSRTTTLVLGPNGRLTGKHKDRVRSHVTAQPSTPPPIQVDTPLEDVTADVAEPPEVQSTSVEVPIAPKPKRRRDNKTQVRNHSLGNH